MPTLNMSAFGIKRTSLIGAPLMAQTGPVLKRHVTLAISDLGECQARLSNLAAL
jgi:hypothetical protein